MLTRADIAVNTPRITFLKLLYRLSKNLSPLTSPAEVVVYDAVFPRV